MKRTRTQLFLIVGFGLVLVSSLLVYCQYQRTLQLSERLVSERLTAIASTLQPQLDVAALARLQAKFHDAQTDSTTLVADPDYQKIQSVLKQTFELNELKTPIYTLSFDEDEGVFHLGVSSHNASTYGLHYNSNVDQHIHLYKTGGTIAPYEDDHGSWLSALVPLTLENGTHVAALEVDYPFNDFVMYARDDMKQNIFLAVLILLMVMVCLYMILRKLFLLDEVRSQELELANKEINRKNEDLESSIRYAADIQSSLRPDAKELADFFSDHMVLDLPRDTVSGDFHWFHRLDENRALLAVVDCTGHGVPGAMLAMMGYDLLNDAVCMEGIESPDKILEYLDKRVSETFTSQSGRAHSDGMDMGMCLIDRKAMSLTYSGARRPLKILNSEGAITITGTRRSIGENRSLVAKRDFEIETLQIDPQSRYFIYSDGIQDQFGGERSKKIGSKRLTEWLHKIGTNLRGNGRSQLGGLLQHWKGPEAQVDDICLVGFAV